MTISYAIGRNSTEGRAHTMCIEGTQGTAGRGWEPQGVLHPGGTLAGWGHPGQLTCAGADWLAWPTVTACLPPHRL